LSRQKGLEHAGWLAPVPHDVALACQQLGSPDARIRAPTIAVIAVTTG